jgi:hypothetical protein
MEDSQCTKGWNWGNYRLEKENFSFNVNGQKCFVLPYNQISLSQANGKNEVALELENKNSNSKE